MNLRTMMSKGRRRGAVAVLTGVCMIGILYLTALTLDAGSLMAARRHAQNCTDAAALAGCIELAKTQAQGNTVTLAGIKTAVNLAASQNGFTNGTNCTVAVNWQPTSGNFQNKNSVEVLLTFTRSNLVVSGSNSVTVRSVASCDPPSVTSFPMLMLDPTGADAFWVNSGKLTLGTPTVQVNSNNAHAAVVDGMPASVANAGVRSVGGSTGTFSPAVEHGGSAMSDPYSLVPIPSKAGLTTFNQSTYTPDNSGNVVLNPGYYPNGIYISSGNVTMNPGLYYIEGGNCWINTPGTVTGNKVTLYHNGPNASAQMNTSYGLDVGFCFCPTNNNYTFTPPTSGPYAGMSLFHGPNVTSEAFYDFWGTGTINAGIQYFPNSTLRCWSKSNGVINCNELVAKDFKLTGTHEIYGTSQNGGFSNLTWNATRAANRPATSVFLAE
jgi:Flp pilus assembly protein TadG